MGVTGTYKWDKESGQLVKISDRVASPGNAYSIQETPFAKQVLQGYTNAAQRGPLRNGWKPETIRRVWGS